MVVLLIGGLFGLLRLQDYTGAPVIEIRNETGVALTDVRVEAYQYEAGTRAATASALAPGESISVRGAHDDYEMSLRELQLGGVALARFPDDPFDQPGRMRHRSVPGQRSIYAIDRDGRLRTIQQGDWGGTRRCTCPDGNADRRGSPDCPIDIHSRHDVERANPPPQPVAQAPVSDQGTR